MTPPDVTRSVRDPWPRTIGALTLRYARAADIPALQSFRNLPEVNRFMIRTHVRDDDLAAESLATEGSDTDYSCVVERDGDVVAMGFLELADGPGQDGAPPRSEAMIGYIVAPWAQGLGVGSVLGLELVRAAFDDLAVHRVHAAAYAANPASVRILEGAGLRLERTSPQRLWHAELGWCDEVGYALLDHEWRARAEN